jgi:hypothetical protein
MVRVALTVLVE